MIAIVYAIYAFCRAQNFAFRANSTILHPRVWGPDPLPTAELSRASQRLEDRNKVATGTQSINSSDWGPWLKSHVAYQKLYILSLRRQPRAKIGTGMHCVYVQVNKICALMFKLTQSVKLSQMEDIYLDSKSQIGDSSGSHILGFILLQVLTLPIIIVIDGCFLVLLVFRDQIIHVTLRLWTFQLKCENYSYEILNSIGSKGKFSVCNKTSHADFKISWSSYGMWRLSDRTGWHI